MAIENLLELTFAVTMAKANLLEHYKYTYMYRNRELLQINLGISSIWDAYNRKHSMVKCLIAMPKTKYWKKTYAVDNSLLHYIFKVSHEIMGPGSPILAKWAGVFRCIWVSASFFCHANNIRLFHCCCFTCLGYPGCTWVSWPETRESVNKKCESRF